MKGRSPVAALLAWAIVCGGGQAHAWQSTTIVDHGSPSSKVDLVFLGDGYTSDELAQYQADVQHFTDALFTQPPFSQYQGFFNVHRVDVISQQSGTDDHCLGTFVDTALDTGFYSTGTDCRLLFTTSSDKVFAAAASAPASDVIIILVNTLTYGGAATFGGYGVFYRGSAGAEVMAHELGHSFGFLADEYAYGGPTTYTGPEPSLLDVTINADRATLKWGAWVDPATPFPTLTTTSDTPGLYEGAMYSQYGIYRPTYNSKMRSLYVPFERVNHSSLVDRIFDYVPPDPTEATASLTIEGACGLAVRHAAVQVGVTAADPQSYVLAYRISSTTSFAATPWQPASNQTDFSTVVPWTLSSMEGLQTLYAQVRNGYGLIANASCAITFDTIAPSVPGIPTAPSPNDGTFPVAWTASTDAGSGVAYYELQRSADGGSTFTTIAAVSSASFTETGLSVGVYAYRVRAVDRADNLSGFSSTSAPIRVIAQIIPDIKANGSDGPVAIKRWSSLTVTMALQAGSSIGLPTELWGEAVTPSGRYWLTPSLTWVLSETPVAFSTGPLVELATFPVLRTRTLKAGQYTYRFSVDTHPDGILQAAYSDTVAVTVKSK